MRWRLAIGLVLSAATLNGCSCNAPVPVLHVSPGTAVKTGQVVTFDANQRQGEENDGLNTDTVVSWDLDGDGQFGEHPGERVVQKSFDTPGTYKVSFDAMNMVFDSIWAEAAPVHGYATKTIVVTAPTGGPGENAVPTASFTVNPDPAITEYAGTYDASGSTDSDGQVVNYQWRWGDGGPDTATTTPSTKHSYALSGTYTVRLTVTDDKGATGFTERTVQVQDGPPPGKVIAREAAGITAAGAGTPFSLGLDRVKPTLGTTTISGTKLVTAGIRAHGRLRFRRRLAILGRPGSARWAGLISLIQRGNAAKAKLSGQGYFLLAISRRNSLCLATTAGASLSSGRVTGRLAAAGGTGRGARLRGTGTFSKAIQSRGRVLNGRLKLRQVRKARRLPRACRTLARTLRR